ncbi:MAG: hypothetical protein M1820_009746 [Bogoriella megaspora]|nr:MAG: hypothetical protein M1820_009746 [Bogoriella megaspora]
MAAFPNDVPMSFLVREARQLLFNDVEWADEYAQSALKQFRQLPKEKRNRADAWCARYLSEGLRQNAQGLKELVNYLREASGLKIIEGNLDIDEELERDKFLKPTPPPLTDPPEYEIAEMYSAPNQSSEREKQLSEMKAAIAAKMRAKEKEKATVDKSTGEAGQSTSQASASVTAPAESSASKPDERASSSATMSEKSKGKQKAPRTNSPDPNLRFITGNSAVDNEQRTAQEEYDSNLASELQRKEYQKAADTLNAIMAGKKPEPRERKRKATRQTPEGAEDQIVVKNPRAAEITESISLENLRQFVPEFARAGELDEETGEYTLKLGEKKSTVNISDVVVDPRDNDPKGQRLTDAKEMAKYIKGAETRQLAGCGALPIKSKLAKGYKGSQDMPFTKRGDLSETNVLRQLTPAAAESVGLSKVVLKHLGFRYIWGAHDVDPSTYRPDGTFKISRPPAILQNRSSGGTFVSKDAKKGPDDPLADERVNPLFKKKAMLATLNRCAVSAKEIGMTRVGVQWQRIEKAALDSVKKELQLEHIKEEQRQAYAAWEKRLEERMDFLRVKVAESHILLQGYESKFNRINHTLGTNFSHPVAAHEQIKNICSVRLLKGRAKRPKAKDSASEGESSSTGRPKTLRTDGSLHLGRHFVDTRRLPVSSYTDASTQTEGDAVAIPGGVAPAAGPSNDNGQQVKDGRTWVRTDDDLEIAEALLRSQEERNSD